MFKYLFSYEDFIELTKDWKYVSKETVESLENMVSAEYQGVDRVAQQLVAHLTLSIEPY